MRPFFISSLKDANMELSGVLLPDQERCVVGLGCHTETYVWLFTISAKLVSPRKSNRYALSAEVEFNFAAPCRCAG